MWAISLPHWWEFVARAVIVYLFLLAALRLTGKRQVGQLAPFDLVLLMVLSNAVQNAMNGGDNSITGGIILAMTLVALNWSMGWLTVRSKRIELLIEGRPVFLVRDGHVDFKALKQVQMTPHELDIAMRSAGIPGPEGAKVAILENNGHVTVLPKKPFTP